MTIKRPKFTHSISGRKAPAVQFVVHPSSFSLLSKTPKAPSRKRAAGPRIFTFSVEGSLKSLVDTMEDSTMSHPVADDPSSPSVLFDEIDFTFDGELCPADEDVGSAEPDTARKVSLNRIY